MTFARGLGLMDDVITDTLESWGEVGVLMLMLLENLIPPIPSEVVMPAAGAAARSGESSLFLMIVAGSFGSLLGQVPWYMLARYYGTKRFSRWTRAHGHWVGIDQGDVRRADEWFGRYGVWTVLLGRLVPGVRTVISVPAGLAEMPVGRFLIATAIGTTAWTALLAAVGYWLEQQRSVVRLTLEWAGVVVVAVLLALFVVRLIRRKVGSSTD